MSKLRLVLDDTADDVARRVAERFRTLLHTKLTNPNPVHIALTGGGMGEWVLGAIADNAMVEAVEWERVHFWWGDERFVPRDCKERNAGQARRALLDRIQPPPENVHEMPAACEGQGLDSARDSYAEELARFATDEHPWPAFTLCFLGVGEDGHIASLFPQRSEIEVTTDAVVAVRDAPKPPPERLSLSLPVLNSADRVWLVVAGTDKASILRKTFLDGDVPAARVNGTIQTLMFADHAAAAELSVSCLRPAKEIPHS